MIRLTKGETEAFLHSREHNVYFKDSVEGLAEDHTALRKVKIVSIFSFFDRPDIVFTPKDQVRFYGRAAE